MVSESEIFDRSGPSDLTRIDWNNADHQRSVAACLVQAVYVLERDRQEKREGPQALAPRWWEFFNFQLLRKLEDKANPSIFGAIFEYKPPPSSGNHSADGPHFVVAFRGTLIKVETFCQDMKLNAKLIRNELPSAYRCETATQAVQDMVATAGDSRVWLAGHSLGSAIALQAGKNMAKQGLFLESFLFNPPYLSTPLEKIENESLKRAVHFGTDVGRAAWAIATKSRQQLNQSANSFAALSPWVPRLFVNKVDKICLGYIDYFDRRVSMQKMGAGGLGRFASQHSLGSLVMSKKGKQAEPLHFIPSANLIINLDPPPEFRRAHGILEWWKQDLKLKTKVYKYKN
ncbi:GDSL esterase/lipase At4g10955-like [Syzygium oleosum]|uniref:GDSL esterase/lipase At4g10955-like n=1 Tax=Syzygium oleosum TaxID=219896 RepID=UPI0011D1CC94|nr:GDSL esterase/lipase At4g10955-like [Syzygium oleosum]